MNRGVWLDAAAVGTWLVCGIAPGSAIARGTLTGGLAASWTVAFAVYGMSLLTVLRWHNRSGGTRRAALALIALQSLAGATANYVTVAALGSTGAGVGLLVIVAAELPHLLPVRATSIWLAAQTALMAGLFVGRDDLTDVVSYTLAISGFQAFAVASTWLMLNEARARDQLSLAHAELLGTRALLAETSRVDERLRISRDLHDTLGHHLTALTLQLDVASRLAGEPAVTHVRQAHAIAKLLLADVRVVVSDLRDGSRIDVAAALRALAPASAGMAVHLEIAEAIALDDSARGEALLRAVQEIITNARKHAHARHLWVRVQETADGVALDARDDGIGADVVTAGNGLTGMRERFQQYAGRVDVHTERGAGFEVHAFLPRVQAS